MRGKRLSALSVVLGLLLVLFLTRLLNGGMVTGRGKKVGVGGINKAETANFLPYVQELGVGWVRIDVSGEKISAINLKEYEITFRAARNFNVLLTLVVRQVPSLAEWKSFLRELLEILAHYPNIKIVELGNEPDFHNIQGQPVFFTGSVDDYLRLFKAGYKLIKEERADIKVIVAATANNLRGVEYFDRLVERMDNPTFRADGFGVHAYNDPQILKARLVHWRAKLKTIGVESPFLVVTEWGVESSLEEEQGIRLTEGLEVAFRNGADLVFIFEIFNATGWGIVGVDGEPLESFRQVVLWLR